MKPVITIKNVELIYPHLTAPNTKFVPAGTYETYVRMSMEDAKNLWAKVKNYIAGDLEQMVRDRKFSADTKAINPIRNSLDRDKKEIKDFVDIKIKNNASFTDFKSKEVINWTPKLWNSDCTPYDIKVPIYSGTIADVAFIPGLAYVQNKLYTTCRLQSVCVRKLVTGGGRTAADYGFESIVAPVDNTSDITEVSTRNDGNNMDF